jgi:hypothetical protein
MPNRTRAGFFIAALPLAAFKGRFSWPRVWRWRRPIFTKGFSPSISCGEPLSLLEKWKSGHGMSRPWIECGAFGTAKREEENMFDESEAATPLSTDEFAHLGQGAIAYVKTIRSEDVARLFPHAPAVAPGLNLFMLSGADGVPILLTDSRDAALANAMQHSLQTVSVH